jgi:hypothetical protein
MSTKDAKALTVGKSVGWRNMTNLVNYLATVTTNDGKSSMSVTVTSDSSVHTFALGADGTVELPLLVLA